MLSAGLVPVAGTACVRLVCPHTGAARMRHYLLHATYTPQAWAARPTDLNAQRDACRRLFERRGSRLDCWYYAFGPRDILVILQLPPELALSAFMQALQDSIDGAAFAA